MLLNFMLLLDEAPQKGGYIMPFVMFFLIFVVMYFFIIQPQQRKQKQLKEMRKSLGKGDKIVTQGGIFGTIVDVKENYFLVEIDSNVKIRVVKDLVYKDATEIAIK